MVLFDQDNTETTGISLYRYFEQNRSLPAKEKVIHSVTITITHNNSFINLSEVKEVNREIKEIGAIILGGVEKKFSRTLTYTSGGLCQFKGTQKASPMANLTIGEFAATKFKKLGVHSVGVRLLGAGKKTTETLKGLVTQGLLITCIVQDCGFAHNGTRRKKARRT